MLLSFATGKHSSLLEQFIHYENKQVLWMLWLVLKLTELLHSTNVNVLRQAYGREPKSCLG
jgi:hypothetical protein